MIYVLFNFNRALGFVFSLGVIFCCVLLPSGWGIISLVGMGICLFMHVILKDAFLKQSHLDAERNLPPVTRTPIDHTSEQFRQAKEIRRRNRLVD